MATQNNPAARLLTIINTGKTKPVEKSAAETWAELLSVPVSDKSLLLQRVGHVMALPSQIRERFTSLNYVDHEVYLKWLPAVEASFSILNFQIPWKEFINRFDAAAIYGMEVCSDLLSRGCPEKVADNAQLSELKNQIEDLINSINSQEMDFDLRKFIYEHLVKIRSSIEEYHITGIVPLEQEFQSAIGSVALTPDIYHRSHDTSLGRRFWEVMSRLAMVVTITAGTIQIGKDVVSLLPPPDQNGAGASTEHQELHQYSKKGPIQT